MRKIKITIDKRTELMSVLLYISNYRKEYPNLINYNRDIPYVNDIYVAFSKFSNHKAVKLLNEITEKCNFSYNAPYDLAMQLNDDFSLTKLLDNPFVTRLESNPIVEEFMHEVKDFADKSQFEKFYDEHAEFYQKCIDEFKSTIEMEYLSKFEEFYRIKTNTTYIINLLTMSANEGMYYGMKIKNCNILHFRNKNREAIRFDDNETNTAAVFKVFSMAYLRKIVEDKKLNVPITNDFVEILKTKYTPSCNVQFICGEIAKVLAAIFHEENFPNAKPTKFERENWQNVDRVKKVYKVLKEWRDEKVTFIDGLQKAINLY